MIQISRAKLLLIDARRGAEHAGEQRFLRHFEREHRHGFAFFGFVATCCAIFSAKAVLPMAGRAARMTSSPSCRPPVISSSFKIQC